MTPLVPPPGMATLPRYDSGWVRDDGERTSFLSYVDQVSVNWSDELEELHEESSKTHFADIWTRNAILSRPGTLHESATVVDVGCSTGYLLEDIRRAYPHLALVGVDLVTMGLRKAHELVPAAQLIQADVCNLPLEDRSVDAVVSANLLEHVPDDRLALALAEIARILVPGGHAVIVVPAGPGTYDYYDRFLGHERRYGRGELAAKAREVGLRVAEDGYIASLLYPAFWVVKHRNRRRYGHLEGEALKRRVAADIAVTRDSRIGRILWRLEERLPIRLPFGIRNLVVLVREDK